jgi:hypothetical protein
MPKNRLFVPALAAAAIALVEAPYLAAQQYAPAPETYSITQLSSLMGPTVIERIWRDGSKAVIELSTPSAQPGGKASHVRTFYDLATRTNVSWDPTNPAPQCGTGTYGGDWGDPFASSAEMNADLLSKKVTQSGTETINGISAKVVNADMGADGKASVWIEPKYGLIMKAELTAPNQAPRVMLQTQTVSFAKPPAATFALPAGCSTTPGAAPSADDEQIAAETGEPASNFSKATAPPATSQSCTVLFRMVQKGSMATLTGGYQLGIDRDVDDQHPADYQFGTDAGGHMLVSGGHLTEVTRQMQNGVLRLDNAPKELHIEIRVPNGGGAATLYRQCAGPQTTLLLVVSSLDKLSPGDWLWVKSGKQAGH